MVRTPSSENWRIDSNGRAVGFLHLHFADAIYGDLIITKKISSETLEVILEELDYRLVDSADDRVDFIFSVYSGEEIASYSDIVDHNLSPLIKKDLEEQKNLISSFISRYQDVRGQLNEHVVKEYFGKLGYQSVKANTELDHLKIDVVAEGENEVIYCQVKLGKLDERKMSDIVKSISCVKQILNDKRKMVAIVAESFPINVELIKENLENEFNVKVWYIFKSQVLNALPEYKRTLRS
jgi:Holliday junction resolvase-like predicted endonuclease